MKCSLRLALVVVLAVILAGCAGPATPAPTPDAEMAQLSSMAAQALPLAQKIAPDAVLRQIDSDAYQTFFDYTDAAASKEVTVWVKSPGAPPAQWQAQPAAQSNLVSPGESGIDLTSVKVGFGRAAQIITVYWPGCLMQTLTLFNQNNKPTWLGFCKNSDGIVSGMVDAQTGNLTITTSATPVAFPTKVPAIQ